MKDGVVLCGARFGLSAPTRSNSRSPNVATSSQLHRFKALSIEFFSSVCIKSNMAARLQFVDHVRTGPSPTQDTHSSGFPSCVTCLSQVGQHIHSSRLEQQRSGDAIQFFGPPLAACRSSRKCFVSTFTLASADATGREGQSRQIRPCYRQDKGASWLTEATPYIKVLCFGKWFGLEIQGPIYFFRKCRPVESFGNMMRKFGSPSDPGLKLLQLSRICENTAGKMDAARRACCYQVRGGRAMTRGTVRRFDDKLEAVGFQLRDQ